MQLRGVCSFPTHDDYNFPGCLEVNHYHYILHIFFSLFFFFLLLDLFIFNEKHKHGFRAFAIQITSPFNYGPG